MSFSGFGTPSAATGATGMMVSLRFNGTMVHHDDSHHTGFSFGAAAPNTTANHTGAKPAPGFGGTTTSLFGGVTPAFGGAAAAAPSTTSGTPATSSTPLLFGGAGSGTTPSPLFGSAAPGNASSSATTGGLFGASSAQPKAPSLFGGAAATPAPGNTQPPSSLFGGTASSTLSATPAAAKPVTSFSLGGKPAASITTASTPAAPLFGTAASTASKPAPSLFGSVPPPATPAAAPSADAAKATPGPLKLGDLGGTTTTAAKPSTTTGSAITETTVAAAAATSKSNPSLIALQNKTLEDILTKWQNELSSTSLAFHSQAAAISRNDEIILQNGLAISQLSQSIADSTNMQADIKGLLDGVEAQQMDLEAVLDMYIGQIKEFREKEDVRLRNTPADEEREKMYYLAESISSNLESLSSQVTSLVSHMNEDAVESSLSTMNGNMSDGKNTLSAVTQILAQHYRSLEWLEGSTKQLSNELASLDRLSSAKFNQTR